MPSDELTTFVNLFEATPPGDLDDVEGARAAYDMLGEMLPPAAGVTATDDVVGGVPGVWFEPEDGAGTRTILYLHGGGFVIGSRTSHSTLAGELAKAAPARVFLAEYRLAPEAPHPAAIQDALAAYRALLADTPSTSLAIVGDSAGGGLTLSTVIALRDAGGQTGDPDDALPAAVAVISPWVDLTQSGDTMTSIGDADPLIKPSMLDAWATMLLGDERDDPGAPDVSPLFADLRGLPPMLIQVGDREALLDDSRRLAARSQEHGVDTQLVVADGMIHHWHLFGSAVPESMTAIAELGAWLAERTAS